MIVYKLFSWLLRSQQEDNNNYLDITNVPLETGYIQVTIFMIFMVFTYK